MAKESCEDIFAKEFDFCNNNFPIGSKEQDDCAKSAFPGT